MKTAAPSLTRSDDGYWISDSLAMAPFLMAIAGASDSWLFISSTGGLTAGRRNADHALFPYETEDKIRDGAAHTGGFTVIEEASGAHPLWQPLSPQAARIDGTRRLHKTALGDAVTFEETHEELGLTFAVTWRTSSTFGLVRQCRLRETRGSARSLLVVDGLVNLLPPGASVAVQRNLSNLLDAYKVTDVDPDTGLGVVYLNSLLTDLAEPAESLAATTVWQVGLRPEDHLLTPRYLLALRAGAQPPGERQVRGERAAYLTRARVELAAHGEASWTTLADVGLDSAQVADLRESIRDHAAAASRVGAALIGDRGRLRSLVASADGLQCTGDAVAADHHTANVLFNIMRGGVVQDGYRLRVEDLLDYVHHRNRQVAETLRAQLPTSLADDLTVSKLNDWAAGTGDPDLIRLLRSFLPLTFGRRHGDPSRPWNKFDIVVSGPDGKPRSDYQGNWRDIFQNWEALAWSFPGYLSGMISTFVDATTLDGYNPYRISRAGIDWETPDPEDPWANIGYWSDHQIVYLLALLETCDAFNPGEVATMLHQRVFTSADVPYRLADFDQMLVDARDTITFDQAAHDAARERAARIGGDGLLVYDGAGELVRSTLAEKLLLLLCAKLVNLVPLGGLWMNTQRPEWNDANNALVGRGLSVVTVAYLRRYLVYLTPLLTAAGRDVEVSAELAALVGRLSGLLRDVLPALGGDAWAERCRTVIEDLGRAGADYRRQVYQGPTGERTKLTADQVRELLTVAREHCEATLQANRRADGLFHGYNTMTLSDDEVIVGRLPLMLEGQVAVLASGFLDASAARAMLSALRESPLYRADQHSYQLYPDVETRPFLERNKLPAAADDLELLPALAGRGDRTVVVRDSLGTWHFAAPLHNAKDLSQRLDELQRDDDLAALVERDRDAVMAMFEQVFEHGSFIGRSGSFFAFEGLGSIYWHMVSKLLLGIQRAALAADPVDPFLLAAYEDVRRGLGYCKDPGTYGAFPTDPYSHTPAGHGARQPGMTGQVKEEVIARFAEVGVRCQDGRIATDARLVRPTEWLTEPATFAYVDVHHQPRSLELDAGSFAFTWCQVPVVVYAAGDPGWRVRWADGRSTQEAGAELPRAVSEQVFARAGTVESLTAHLGVDIDVGGGPVPGG